MIVLLAAQVIWSNYWSNRTLTALYYIEIILNTFSRVKRESVAYTEDWNRVPRVTSQKHYNLAIRPNTLFILTPIIDIINQEAYSSQRNI